MCFTLALAYALALASVISYNHKWYYNLEHHTLTMLALSIMIVICLKYRPQVASLRPLWSRLRTDLLMDYKYVNMHANCHFVNLYR